MVRQPDNLLLILLGLSAFLWSARAGAQFEGIVESRNSTVDELGKTQHFVMTMWIRSDRLKIHNTEMGSTPATTMIYRLDKHLMWILNDEEKSYFEVLREGPQQAPPAAPEGEKVRVVRTGKTKKILGYPCERILILRGEESTEIWGTKKLESLAKAISNLVGSEGEPGWSDELEKLGVFPLSAASKLGGAVVESQEVYKIESREIPDALFEIPPGYIKEKVKEMPGAK